MGKIKRHPGKMVSPSMAWAANHLSGISNKILGVNWIPDTNLRFQVKALDSGKFRDDGHKAISHV